MPAVSDLHFQAIFENSRDAVIKRERVIYIYKPKERVKTAQHTIWSIHFICISNEFDDYLVDTILESVGGMCDDLCAISPLHV